MPVHALSIVDPQAEIHPEAVVGPFCVIRGAVRLAAGVELRNHATVYGRTTIGTGSILFPGCVVGCDPQDLKFKGEDSETIIGERVRIHECATVSKGTASGGMRTVIGDECLVMAYAHIGHDCILDRNVVIANNAQLAGHVHLGRKAWVSGMTGVHHFATIGELAFVGGMSGVRVDLPPFMFAEGLPAEIRNINQVGLERDGVSKEEITRLREAFRQLYRDRTEPMAQVLDRLSAQLGGASGTPLAKLVAWQREHLESSVKGRLAEGARRTPVPSASSL